MKQNLSLLFAKKFILKKYLLKLQFQCWKSFRISLKNNHNYTFYFIRRSQNTS